MSVRKGRELELLEASRRSMVVNIMEKGRNSAGKDSRFLAQSAEQPDTLLTLHHQAVDEYSEGNYEAALETLKRTEEILELYTTQGSGVDQDIVLCTLNNIACCYQKYFPRRQEMTEQCAAYLEACLAPSPSRLSTNLKELAYDLKVVKYQCIVHVQLCALLSQLGNHSEALVKARQASRLARYCLEASIQAFKMLNAKYQQLKRKKVPVPDSMLQSQILMQRALPTLKCLETFFATGDIELEEDPQMRSVLGVKAFGDWVYALSISDIMAIQPLLVEELKLKPKVRAEFAKDSMLHKVAHLAVAYFCVSTELKFLRGKQAFNPERDRDGEALHNKAVVLLETFFPVECPLLSHVTQTYEKRFVTELHEIPEAAESSGRLVRKSSARAKTSRMRKTTKSHDFSSLPQLPDQQPKRANTPVKAIASSRGSTRSQSNLKPRNYDQTRTPAKKSRTRSEAFIGEQFYKKRSSSRLRGAEQKPGEMPKLRSRRNKSAELVRRTDGEGSLEQEQKAASSQFFIS